MKNKFLLLCLLVGITHNAYIMSSYEDFCKKSIDINLETTWGFNDIDDIQNQHKYLIIANLIEKHGLTATQAEDAFEKGLSPEQALEAVENETLKTLEKLLQRNRERIKYFEFENENLLASLEREYAMAINLQQERTNRYINIKAFIYSGLSYSQAGTAHHHSLTLEQAIQMKDMLYKRNRNSNNEGIYEIITQIKELAKEEDNK